MQMQNNRCRTDHIPQLHAKFGGNR